MSIKFLVLGGGGGILGFGGGGGSADFIFMGAGIFLIDGPALRNANRGDSRASIRKNQFAEEKKN